MGGVRVAPIGSTVNRPDGGAVVRIRYKNCGMHAGTGYTEMRMHTCIGWIQLAYVIPQGELCVNRLVGV